MKTMIFLFITVLSTTISLAGNAAEQDPENRFPAEIAQLMNAQHPFFDEDLSGNAAITFTVDAQNVVHILDVQSSNIFLRSHALLALDGHHLSENTFEQNKVYTISINFIYAG